MSAPGRYDELTERAQRMRAEASASLHLHDSSWHCLSHALYPDDASYSSPGLNSNTIHAGGPCLSHMPR